MNELKPLTMNDKITEWLIHTPIALILISIVILILIVVIIIGFIQGREITLWPPKIGSFEKTKKIKLEIEEQEGKTRIDIYEAGRMKIHEKVTFFNNSKIEVIELGIALSTFSSFFIQRPEHEYRKPVINLLKSGVNFKCLVLNPDSEIAKIYANNTGEDKIPDKIRASKEDLKSLQVEFKEMGCKGNFDIYQYSKLPYCYMLLVDPSDSSGRAYISHYLYGLKRADAPILEVHKKNNPILFDKYYSMAKELINDSKLID
jgi:hypothetical protein